MIKFLFELLFGKWKKKNTDYKTFKKYTEDAQREALKIYVKKD